jgi:hypothetical protein
MAAADKQETIEEEGDVATVEESVADEPVQEEGENSDPTSTDKVEESAEVKDAEVLGEEPKEQSSGFACCQGSSADVLKNLQAAVGMVA